MDLLLSLIDKGGSVAHCLFLAPVPIVLAPPLLALAICGARDAFSLTSVSTPPPSRNDALATSETKGTSLHSLQTGFEVTIHELFTVHSRWQRVRDRFHTLPS